MATIYMPLLNEGTNVWRQVAATLVSNNTYRIEGDVPDDEEWERPGAVVCTAERKFDDGTVGLVAFKLA
jgi:hypothetical protein